MCRYRGRESAVSLIFPYKQDAQLMNNRRDFLKASAMGAAATLLPQNDLIGSPGPASAQEGRLRKGVLITMLPKQMSYLDRFKLAVDVGFEGVEAQTVTDPKEADQIKEA